MYISSNAFVQLEISFILVIPGTIGWLSRKWSCYILSFSRVLNYSPFCVIVCSLVNAWLVFKNKSKKHLISLLQDITKFFYNRYTFIIWKVHKMFNKIHECELRMQNDSAGFLFTSFYYFVLKFPISFKIIHRNQKGWYQVF